MSCPSNSSGLLTSSAAIATRACMLTSLIVLADGTNAATVTLYDDAAAAVAGKEVAKIVVDAGLTYELFHADGGVVCNKGLYAVISGTGAACIAHYRLA